MKKIGIISVISILLGTVLEWYDFSLLGSMASIIATLFFPSKTSLISLLATFGVFASGFIARPIGAVIFGHIGDRKGRRAALSMTLILMALPTALVGVLPTFQTAGVIAPVLLVLLRLIQGAASSGEYPGAICFLTEIAPSERRGLFGSLSVFGVIGGIFFGLLVTSILSSNLSNEAMHDWGWRIPFLLTLPLGLLGWYVRYKLPETEVFQFLQSAQKIHRRPLHHLIKFNFIALVKTMILYSLGNITFYLCFFYIGTYLVSIHKISLQQALFNNVVSMLVLIFLLPIFGWLSDKINRKWLLLTGAGCLLLFYYPIFNLFFINQTTLLCGQILLAIFMAIFSGPIAVIASESFSPGTRFTGVSIALNMGATIFGGTSPLIATYLVHWSGKGVMPCVYPILSAVICMLVVMRVKEKVSEIPSAEAL